MDSSSLYAQWASQPQLLQAESSSHHQSPPTSNIVDDWTKDRPTTTAIQTNGVGSPLGTGSGLDLGDFGLGDLGSATTSSSSVVSPTSSFYTPYQHSSYFMGYGATPYGLWPNQNVPLSNYSTLNGATTSSTAQSSSNSIPTTPSQNHSSPPAQHTQSQPQTQLHSPPPTKPSMSADVQATASSSNPQPMNIDPALTTLNGSGNTNLSSYSTHYSPSTSQQQQQLHLQHLLSIYGRSYYHTQSQQQQGAQGTLSPQALHSPSSNILQTVLPSSFYPNASSSIPPVAPTSQSVSHPTQLSQLLQPTQPPAPPPPPKLTLEERNNRLMASIKHLLVPKNFSGAAAVNNISDKIADFPASEVPASTRLEILTKIRDGAGNHYFRAWSENITAMDVTRDWLKAAFLADPESPLVETFMPLLHIIDRLPMTVETLKMSKLGKLIVKVVKDPPFDAVKDLASNVEKRWRSLVVGAENAHKASDTEDLKSKKRKLPESSAPPKGPAIPPTKKPALGTSTASKPVTVKKEPAPTAKVGAVSAVKDAKSDSSFFSAPKPKKLPSFKKAPPTAVPARATANIAQPSAEDPFQEALKSMASRRKESPAVSTPPSTTAASATTSQPQFAKSGKKQKTVTWAVEDKLVSVRLIEKAIYDDDPKDGVHVAHSIRELDRSEGAALHAHMFEETVDWTEPLSIDFTGQDELPLRGEASEERIRQEKRETTALGALYINPAQVPDSPAEPAHVISEDETDKNVTTMVCGPDADAVFWSGPPLTPQQSVADLVGQLASGNMAVDPAVNNTPFNATGLDLGAVGLQQTSSISAIAALPQEQLQQLLQQLASTPGGIPNLFGMGGGDQPQQPPFGNTADQPGWVSNNYGSSMDYTPSSYQDEESRGGSWRGGFRGRGRGRGDGGFRRSKSRPCSFFAQGRCKFGDQCDFSHDLEGGYS